ncbi:MAG: cold-shock protein [Rhodobacteraceae bacterium]|nr:cold-shock protein [Paracoccaceae bacterium]
MQGWNMHTGTVLWYDESRGYGFVADHFDNQKIFVTHSELEDFGVSALNRGSKICYEVMRGRSSSKISSIKSLVPECRLH